MATITQQCPHCGNIVEGKKVKTYTNKVTRQGAKTAVHMATSAGGMATGAAVGSAILPGIGTVVGGALGFIGSAMFNQKVNENIDKAGDAIEDNFMDMDYVFTCPKCGHTWTSNDTDYSDEVDDDDEYYVEEIDDEDDDDDEYYVDEVDDEDDEEDDDNEDYNPERDRFLSFLDSFIKDEYKDMDVEKRAEMFKREGDSCDDDLPKACFYFLAALSRLEYFVGEWLENDFRNYSHTQERLQTICLKKGYEEIQESRELEPEHYEFEYVSGIICMLKEFWIDSEGSPEFCEVWEQELGDKTLDEGECLLNPEYYQNIFTASLERIKSYVEQSAPETSGEGLSAGEEEYLNEYKEMLADGEISDRDRRYLNKIMNSNGISEARAKELEAMASSPSLTDEEQEYLNEYRDMISDGEISPRDQRFLDKLKKTNGISEARAKELEAMA